MRKAFLRRGFFARFASILIWFLLPVVSAAQRRPHINVTPENTFSSDWLTFNPERKTFAAWPGVSANSRQAFYQWVAINPDYPFPVEFTAAPGLCFFLNNRLVFKADSAANYTLDLTILIPLRAKGNYLLTVWNPAGIINLASFENHVANAEPEKTASIPNTIQIKPRHQTNQNAFVIFLLVIGLIYGNLRSSFATDFHSVLQSGKIWRRLNDEEGFLSKPVVSWPGMLFMLAFSISFSVLVVAIQMYSLNDFIFNRFFTITDTDIFGKILINTGLVFCFILFRYIFLAVLGYVFNLSEVVALQYREFLRGILFMGLFLPFLILIYLLFDQTYPALISTIAGFVLALLLITMVLRVIFLLNRKVPVLNLHFFSYLCATEIIPLAIVLKLILFDY